MVLTKRKYIHGTPDRKKRGARIRLVVELLILFGLVASLRFILPWIVLQPTAEITYTPESNGMAYEDVTLTTEDGVKISGWYVPAKFPRGTLLFFHGNAGNLSNRVDSIDVFHRLGISVFIIDYRGYGRSEGTRSLDGTALDALAAWKWLTEERAVPADDIVVFGRSIGGAVAMQLMRHIQPRALILESTFSSMPDLVRVDFLVPLARFVIGDVFNSVEVAQALDVPVLCIHSSGDKIVPYRYGKRLYDAIASEEKAFVDIHGGHNEGYFESYDIYAPALDAFFTEHFGPRFSF